MTDDFAAALEQAKKDRIPVMALRPHHEFPDEMDDIVIENVETFRMEQMSDDNWWMMCRFANGEDITFSIQREKKPPRVSVTVTDMPSEWQDWDELRGH